MWPYILKIILSAAVLVTVAGLAKRSSFWAAALVYGMTALTRNVGDFEMYGVKLLNPRVWK